MAIRDKDYCILVLDCGASTAAKISLTLEKPQRGLQLLLLSSEANQVDSPASDGKSKNTIFHFAQACLIAFLQERQIYHPHHEVCIILVGCEETANELYDETGDFKNLAVAFHLGLPEASWSKSEWLTTQLDVDPFLGIMLAADYFDRHVKAKRGRKQILLLTAGTKSPRADIRDSAPALVELLKNQAVELDVVWYSGSESNSLLAADRCFFESLVSQMGRSVVSGEEFANRITSPRKPHVSCVTKTRLPLSIADGAITIPVWTYLKTSSPGTPTFKTEAISGGPAVMERIYIAKGIAEHEDQRTEDQTATSEEVPPDRRMKGYLYGRDLVPVSEVERSVFKFSGGDKLLKVIGTVPKTWVPIYFMKDKTEIVVPDPTSPMAKLALSDLVLGLNRQQMVMVARYVWRQGAAPKLVALSPHPKVGSLYLNILGFAEDFRSLSFRPLPQASNAQVAAFEDFIDSMNLVIESPCQKPPKPVDTELYKPSKVFNPTLQKQFRYLFLRGADPQRNNLDFADLDRVLLTAAEIEASKKGKRGNGANGKDWEDPATVLKSLFKLEPVPPKSAKLRRNIYATATGADNRGELRRNLADINVDEKDTDYDAAATAVPGGYESQPTDVTVFTAGKKLKVDSAEEENTSQADTAAPGTLRPTLDSDDG